MHRILSLISSNEASNVKGFIPSVSLCSDNKIEMQDVQSVMVQPCPHCLRFHLRIGRKEGSSGKVWCFQGNNNMFRLREDRLSRDYQVLNKSFVMK